MEHHIATVSALIDDRRRDGHDVSGLKQTLAWLQHSAVKRTRDNDDIPDQAAAQRAIEAAVDRKECPAYEDLMAFVSKDKIKYLWRGEGTNTTSRIFAFVNEKDYDYDWFDEMMYGMSGTWLDANVRATDNVWVFRTYKPTDAEARFITRPEADGGGDEFNGDEEAYNNLVMRDEYLKHELREHGHVYAFEPLAHQGVMVFNFDSWFTIVDEEFWTAERVLARLIRTSAERLRERVDELPTWAREQIAAKNWQKIQHRTAKGDCGEGQIISSAEITEFLQNPRHWILDGFLLTKHLDSEAEDSEEDESVAPLGKIDERLLTWSIFIKNSGKEIAFAQLAGYFDGDDVVIESFWVNPEGQGHGRRIIEWLHNLLAEQSIRLSVTQDQTQEGKGFWYKMYKLGFVQ